MTQLLPTCSIIYIINKNVQSSTRASICITIKISAFPHSELVMCHPMFLDVTTNFYDFLRIFYII